MCPTRIRVEVMKKTERLLLEYSIFIFAALFMVACTNTFRTSNQEENKEDTTIIRLNRNVKIGFQGLMLGTPNKDIPALIKNLPNVTKAEIPYDIEQNSYGSNASIYANEYEKIIATFKSAIIDTTETSHEGYGVVFSDGDSVTQIVFTIMETEAPDSVYFRLLPLFISKYGSPDKTYESEPESYLRNGGAIWIFDNKQRICLNSCVYSGGAMAGFDRIFTTYQRVEIIYQDINALERKNAKERKEKQIEKQKRIDAQNAEKANNRAKREQQQL